MADQPDKKPVPMDSDAVRQHHKLASGTPVKTGGNDDKGPLTKW